MTEARALAKNLNLSAQKMRLIANLIRTMPIERAFDVLSFSTKKAAPIMKKVLQSAVSNAENNHNLDLDDLSIKSIQVNEGPTLKRLNAHHTHYDKHLDHLFFVNSFRKLGAYFSA